MHYQAEGTNKGRQQRCYRNYLNGNVDKEITILGSIEYFKNLAPAAAAIHSSYRSSSLVSCMTLSLGMDRGAESTEENRVLEDLLGEAAVDSASTSGEGVAEGGEGVAEGPAVARGGDPAGGPRRGPETLGPAGRTVALEIRYPRKRERRPNLQKRSAGSPL